MTRIFAIFCLMLATAFAASLCAQDIYKWKDAAGTWHFTEHPPATGKAERVVLNANGATQTSNVDPVAAAKANQQSQQDAEHRQAACENARQNLGLLTQGDMAQRPGTTGGDAESNSTLRLSREQRQAAEINAEKQIQELCDKG